MNYVFAGVLFLVASTCASVMYAEFKDRSAWELIWLPVSVGALPGMFACIV